ncbi:FkbM family methyltransferase [Flavobacterium sp. 3HN19-14]|uniref:FkbM family methyltransferase n=1 Tax=Flavobacterium sp. 3HN19-14 TaxID=3448133 RepID=UPI003EE144F6
MSFRIKLIQTLIGINEAIFFYPKLRKFYQDNLKKTSVSILDVGANKGQTIEFFLKIYPNAKINAFEPNKKLYLQLKDKFKNNNIVVHNVGVSNIKGELLFHENVLMKPLHLKP